jgi:7-carboxy-7-deazaguanine synthase
MRLLESYSTVQGEGPRTGVPTQFVRFAGCNLRCPGWPCDTEHAIEPSLFVNVAVKRTGHEVAANYVRPWPVNICITGGEPLLQKETDLRDLFDDLWESGHTIEMFTNGTQPIPSWMHGRVRFMMDWKLPGSGEDMGKYQEVRLKNAKSLHPTDGVKFVVKNLDDLNEAFDTWTSWQGDVPAQIWVGAVWGEITDEDIVQYILDNVLPWNLNVQVHKHVWPADMQGV